MDQKMLESALREMAPQMAKILLKGNNAEVKLRRHDVIVLDTSKHIAKAVELPRK